jgi:signal transduction histidine kinase
MTNLLIETPLIPKQLDMVNMINTASSSLLNVINDLLDFGSIQHGKLHIEKTLFNLRHFVEDVIISTSFVMQNSSHALDFGYRVEANCPTFVYTDEKRLRQIIQNLMNNAIKFTSNGQVSAVVHYQSAQGSESPNLLFEITDSGIGIKEESIFRP